MNNQESLPLPLPNDVVEVTTGKFVDMGQYVYLKQYNNLEGMLLKSKMKNHRMNGFEEGKSMKLKVIAVDHVHNLIDLSL